MNFETPDEQTNNNKPSVSNKPAPLSSTQQVLSTSRHIETTKKSAMNFETPDEQTNTNKPSVSNKPAPLPSTQQVLSTSRHLETTKKSAMNFETPDEQTNTNKPSVSTQSFIPNYSNQSESSPFKTFTRETRQETSASGKLDLVYNQLYCGGHRYNEYNALFRSDLKECNEEFFDEINHNLLDNLEEWTSSEAIKNDEERNRLQSSIIDSLYHLIQNFQQLFMDTLLYNQDFIFPKIHPIIQTSLSIIDQEIMHDIFTLDNFHHIYTTRAQGATHTQYGICIHQQSLNDMPATLSNVSQYYSSELHNRIFACYGSAGSITLLDETLGNLLMTLFFQRVLHLHYSNDSTTFENFHFHLHSILSHFAYYNFASLSALDIHSTSS